MLNNAALMPQAPLDQLRIDDWDRMMDGKLKGVLYEIAAAPPHYWFSNEGIADEQA